MMKLLCLTLLLAVTVCYVQAQSGPEFIKEATAVYSKAKDRDAVESGLKKFIGSTEPACPLVDEKETAEAKKILSELEGAAKVKCPELQQLLEAPVCIKEKKTSDEVSFLETGTHRRAFIKGRSQTKAGLSQFFSACVTCLTANKLAPEENAEPDCNGAEGRPYKSLGEIRKDYKRRSALKYTPPGDDVVSGWKATESDVKACEEAAHSCYKHRHLARINQRKCMDKLGFFATAARFWTNLRDLCVYGDVDGPTYDYLEKEAAKKCTGDGLAKRLCICKDIIGSAGRTNEKYNKMFKAE